MISATLTKFPSIPYLEDSGLRCNEQVVVTKKMDGECTAMYSDYIHARSVDSKNHPSRDWVKNYHASIKHLIPDNMIVYGENVYAKHSIAYTNLDSYFYGFAVSIYGVILPWHVCKDVFQYLGICPVQELYSGPYTPDIHDPIQAKLDLDADEGYVIRKVNAYEHSEMCRYTAKWVRPDHVQTNKHWLHQTVQTNLLRQSLTSIGGASDSSSRESGISYPSTTDSLY